MVQVQTPSVNSGSQISQNPDSVVHRFFADFGAALTTGDIEKIKNCWGSPAFILGNSIQLVIKTEEDIARFFSGTRVQYTRRGIFEAIPEIESIQWLTPKIALVGVRWPYLGRDGEDLGEESSCYTLKMDTKNVLHIYSVVMQGEHKEKQFTH